VVSLATLWVKLLVLSIRFCTTNKERMKMRKPPKIATVKGKINAYAYKCGFTYHPKEDGTFALFDIKMGYYVCRGSHDRVVQFVMDELWMKWARHYRSTTLAK
jgi:hypothetical protein